MPRNIRGDCDETWENTKGTIGMDWKPNAAQRTILFLASILFAIMAMGLSGEVQTKKYSTRESSFGQDRYSTHSYSTNPYIKEAVACGAISVVSLLAALHQITFSSRAKKNTIV